VFVFADMNFLLKNVTDMGDSTCISLNMHYIGMFLMKAVYLGSKQIYHYIDYFHCECLWRYLREFYLSFM
jgi:hypothetical protein